MVALILLLLVGTSCCLAASEQRTNVGGTNRHKEIKEETQVDLDAMADLDGLILANGTSDSHSRVDLEGTTFSSNDRIFNGQFASPAQFPMFVFLLSEIPDGSACGGTILHSHWILTAGHCLSESKPPLIIVTKFVKYRIGSIDSRVISLEHPPKKGVFEDLYEPEIYFPPGFRYRVGSDVPDNDIALLKTEKPIRFNFNVQAAILPSHPVLAKRIVQAPGWGRTESEGYSRFLKYANMIVAPCPQGHPNNVICAYNNRDSPCTGDSGGYLGSGGVIYGVYSYSHRSKLLDPNRCYGPFVYTNVLHFRNWIITTFITKTHRKRLRV